MSLKSSNQSVNDNTGHVRLSRGKKSTDEPIRLRERIQRRALGTQRAHFESAKDELPVADHTTLQPATTLGGFSSTIVQPQMTVNAPNDRYEVEADRVADQVMRMPVGDLSAWGRPAPTTPKLQLKCEACGSDDETTMRSSDMATPTVTPMIERNIQAMQGGGRPLDDNTRSFFEQRMGADFSNVRIHTDANAVQTSRDINARAFTTGNDIAFNSGEYNPNTAAGKHLLAHELTHTIQQSNGNVSRTIQLAPIATDGGEWDTDKYDIVKNGTKEIGVDIDLKFTPKAPTDAKQIGLTQMVNSIDEGEPIALSETVENRSIPEGEDNAGQHIDQSATNRNPLYAVEAPPDSDTALTDTGADARWGQHAWRYTDASGTLQEQEGHLKDGPQLPSRGKNAKQIFESTALAIEGNQTGTYYGSVQWGWETDDSGTFTQLPLSLVSKGNPTEVFMRAAELWNDNPTSAGKDTIDLPTTYDAGAAGSLSTADLIIALRQAKEDLATLTEVPATTNKDFEVRQMENELRRRTMTVSVTTTEASGDNWLAGDDDVYVKVTYNGQAVQSGEVAMNDGDSHDFQLALADLLPETPMPADFALEGKMLIEVYDSDSFLTGGDDLMAIMTWDAPFAEASHDAGNYQLTAKL